MGDISGDGSFQGIVLPCQTCLGGGRLVSLQGRPEMLLRTGECPTCDGTGHLHIRCAREDVDEVIRRLPPSRLQRAVHQALADNGVCTGCFDAGVLAAVERDENDARRPVRYLEAPCPACQDHPSA